MTSEAQQKALAIVPKISAFASFLGSGFIIHDVFSSHFDWRKESKSAENKNRSLKRHGERKTLKNSAYYRLMLVISIFDFIVSFAKFFGTWAIAKDENSLDNPSEVVHGNIGTIRSCEAQAFFTQLAIIAPCMNALLASYYYFTIRWKWKEVEFERRIERFGYFVAISFGFGTSIACLVTNDFNNAGMWCWIAPYPRGCGSDEIPCTRGQNAKIKQWALFYGPLWFMILLVAVFMTLLYCHVRGIDNKMELYTSTYRNRSPAVAKQGFFFAGIFALTWLFPTIFRAMQLAGAKTIPWAIILLMGIFVPAQGFFNCLVYIRPRVIQYWSEKKKLRERTENSGATKKQSDLSKCSTGSKIVRPGGGTRTRDDDSSRGQEKNGQRSTQTMGTLPVSAPMTDVDEEIEVHSNIENTGADEPPEVADPEEVLAT